MRPGQNNKRMRGRPNNNRKGPNPLTRSYESSGPDVKIRGTAHHIGEKYLQLARDAQSSGDPVTAESYLQHAEHYFRLIALAQAQQQGASGYQRPGDAMAEEIDGDDDFAALPDRFASPIQPFAAPQPGFAPPPPGGGPQPSDRPFYPAPGQDRPPQAPRPVPYQDRPHQEPRAYADRSGQERNNQDRQDRNNQDRNNQDRRGQERYGQEPRGVPRDQPPRDLAPAADDNRASRRRDFRGEGPRDARGAVEEAQPNGLPSFITAPVRPVSEQLPESLDPSSALESLAPVGDDRSDSEREANGFHLRPRRRRRSKAEMAIDQAGQGREPSDAQTSEKDPVGD